VGKTALMALIELRDGVDLREELVRAVERGESLRALAHRFGVTPSTMTHWLAKLGLERTVAVRIRPIGETDGM